jgi:hypothetical protein
MRKLRAERQFHPRRTKISRQSGKLHAGHSGARVAVRGTTGCVGGTATVVGALAPSRVQMGALIEKLRRRLNWRCLSFLGSSTPAQKYYRF